MEPWMDTQSTVIHGGVDGPLFTEMVAEALESVFGIDDELVCIAALDSSDDPTRGSRE